MKVKRKFKALLMLTIMIVSLFGSTITVFADYQSATEVVSAYAPGGTKNTGKAMPASLAGYVTTVTPATTTGTTTVAGIPYYWDTNNDEAIIKAGNSLDKQAAAKAADDANIEEFRSVTDSMNIEADIGTASGILSGFTGVIQTLLGIIVVLVSIGMTIFSGFDLCYIAFPVFRNKCEDAKQTGTGIMAGKGKTASGENKLRFVSDDAQYAVVAADTVQSGKNPFVIYFGKRLISYIVLAILLFILLTGRVTIFTDIALKLVSGILDIIQTI